MLLTAVTLVCCILGLLYLFFSHRSNYWKKRGVIHPKPSIIFGNYAPFFLMRKTLGETIEDICKKYPNEKYVGTIYGTEPAIVVKDPELIKLVTIKDFYHFSSRDLAGHNNKEIITKNVFSGEGDYWKVMRQNMTPIFTSAKMKKMFYLIQNCTKALETFVNEEIRVKQVQEIRTLMGRFTMDCIGSCVFGLEIKSMGNDEKNPFRNVAGQILEVSNDRQAKFMLRSLWPSFFYVLKFELFPQEIYDFFKNLMLSVYQSRDYKPSNRHDFVDSLIAFKQQKRIYGDVLENMKNQDGKKKIGLDVDDEMLIGQSLIFFTAGFETSAATLSFTLYELAKNEEVQRRAIKEVDEYNRKKEGQIEYDCVTSLPYVEACLDETLRLYPVLGALTREVIEPYVLPDGTLLEKGMRVHLPSYYLHKHPDYFPEPEVYRPERFFGDAKKNIEVGTYFPFGEGPRTCIGERFAKMQMMAGIVTFLKKFRVELAEDMPKKVTFEPRNFTTQSVCGINLKIIPRDLVAGPL